MEKWQESVNDGGAFGALMTDFSKAFHSLHHRLEIAKLLVIAKTSNSPWF